MFSSQHWQIKLVYAGFGGFLMLIGMLFSPVSALRDKFGDIKCSSLTVVDKDGHNALLLNVSEYGGRIFVGGNDGVSSAYLTIGKNGGHVVTHGKDGKSGVFLSGMDKNGRGGTISVQDKNGQVVVMLIAADHGGLVSSNSSDLQSWAALGIDEHGAYGKIIGGGAEFVWDKHGYRQ